jgi:uncharacterized protein DUF1707
MPPNPEMRASDADRDRVAAALREHCAQGRITMDELQERLDATYAAKTQGELQEVTADLPETDLYALPVPAAQRASAPARHRSAELYQTGLRANWAVYASVNLICFTIWLITSITSAELIYPWWIWVAGPWGAVLLAGALFGPKKQR